MFERLEPFDELMAASRPARNVMLESSLAALGRELFGPDERLTVVGRPFLARDARFWHGAATVGDDTLVMFFYFEEHDVGLVSFATGASGAGSPDATIFARFTVVRTEPLTMVRGGHA